MKKVFLSALLVLTVSFAFSANDVEKNFTTNVEKNFTTTKSNELIITESNSVELTANLNEEWEFPVYWEDDFGSGEFTMSGDGTIWDIINALLALFF